eukprot:CAMPEP_0174316820 /NCGR_PEP_ID=MMETSP0810-20121108/7206_1 /TAXON_ID=73025 ORGANISM="Eutreptiella gymnastica-like, Strain CCMP1594" /NCGR_SAMPLE_ID=MMETSP0810 /ASSEMBLY_ACC=CAM_ASM_000659 /LENGTH=41 /DNA_ID= /DNA_START= /DNA_END= /DNA_ORIENTATION=
MRPMHPGAPTAAAPPQRAVKQAPTSASGRNKCIPVVLKRAS